jgi:hypothetical protein
VGGSIFVGNGVIQVNGVVDDDVSAKKVTATIRDAEVPDTEVNINLTCVVPGGASVPCDSALNPARIQYFASYAPGPRPAHYILTTTATDGVGGTSTVVQDIIIISYL